MSKKMTEMIIEFKCDHHLYDPLFCKLLKVCTLCFSQFNNIQLIIRTKRCYSKQTR